MKLVDGRGRKGPALEPAPSERKREESSQGAGFKEDSSASGRPRARNAPFPNSCSGTLVQKRNVRVSRTPWSLKAPPRKRKSLPLQLTFSKSSAGNTEQRVADLKEFQINLHLTENCPDCIILSGSGGWTMSDCGHRLDG